MFAGKVDIVSISLNTPDKEEYYRLTRNKFGEESFDGMLRFAENVKKICAESCINYSGNDDYEGRRGKVPADLRQAWGNLQD